MQTYANAGWERNNALFENMRRNYCICGEHAVQY